MRKSCGEYRKTNDRWIPWKTNFKLSFRPGHFPSLENSCFNITRTSTTRSRKVFWGLRKLLHKSHSPKILFVPSFMSALLRKEPTVVEVRVAYLILFFQEERIKYQETHKCYTLPLFPKPKITIFSSYHKIYLQKSSKIPEWNKYKKSRKNINRREIKVKYIDEYKLKK